MSAPPYPEPPPAYSGAPNPYPIQQQPLPTGVWYPPPNQQNVLQQQGQPHPYNVQQGQPYNPYPGAMPQYSNQQPYPTGSYTGQPGNASYPQQVCYPSQPYGSGYQQPQSVVVIKQQQPQSQGPSTGDCCLIALCAMCCACCLADALD